jgi:tetratricopeptide (TPR) repeat protein
VKTYSSSVLAIALALVAATLLVSAIWKSSQLPTLNERIASQPASKPAAAKPDVEQQLPDAAPLPLQSGKSPNLPQSASLSVARQDASLSKDDLEAESQSVVDRLLEAMPNNPRAMHVSAMFNAQLHNTEQALKLWSKCIELDPQSEPYYINLAAIAIERGDSQLAIETMQKALENGMESLAIRHHYGVSLLNAGRIKEAAESTQAALQEYPGSGALWLILGQAQLKSGDLKLAEASLNKAVELGVHTKAAYFALFNVCLRAGKQAEANHFREIYASFNENVINPQQRFTVLSESEARSVCITTRLEAAALYRAAKRLQDAEQQLLRVVAIDSGNLAALLELASVYNQDKRFADELAVRQRMLEIDPDNFMSYLFTAKAAANNRQAVAAETYIKRAIALSPEAVTGYAAMADFWIEQKQPAKAAVYLKQLLAIEPTADGFMYLAQTLKQAGDDVEAQQAEDAARNLRSSPSPASSTKPE